MGGGLGQPGLFFVLSFLGFLSPLRPFIDGCSSNGGRFFWNAEPFVTPNSALKMLLA
jgi:hypothetical protein